MAISLAKTLQTVSYTLYIVSSIKLISPSSHIQVSQNVYESSGHRTDSFLPIISKTVTITDSTAISAIVALLGPNYPGAITLAEQYLVDNVAYYSGGTVVA